MEIRNVPIPAAPVRLDESSAIFADSALDSSPALPDVEDNGFVVVASIVRGGSSMAEVKFTPDLQRHLTASRLEVGGRTVGEVLEQVLENNPRLRGRLVDERGRLQEQIVVFVDGALIEDRARLSDPVEPAAELFVMKALCGS